MFFSRDRKESLATKWEQLWLIEEEIVVEDEIPEEEQIRER